MAIALYEDFRCDVGRCAAIRVCFLSYLRELFSETEVDHLDMPSFSHRNHQVLRLQVSVNYRVTVEIAQG